MEFSKDDFVRLPAEAGGQVGRVIEDSAGGKVRVQFADGVRIFKLEYCAMSKIEANEETAALVQSLSVKTRKAGVAAKTLEELVQVFLTEYPDGFEDAKYMTEERGSKWTAHQQLNAQLGQAVFRGMLDAQRYADVTPNVLSVIDASTLLSHFEVLALKKALKDEALQKSFADSLYTLLYGEGDPESRFSGFVSVLQTMNSAKWPIATYFLLLHDPRKNLVLKPEAGRAVASLCGIDLQYAVLPNWRTYSRVLQMGEALMQRLPQAGLRPRDMVDVQSFMGAATRLDKKGVRAPASEN